MGIRSALVVGAGIAGSTLASLLGRSGVATTVVERGRQQRSSGSPVDVRGPALAVVEQLGVLEPIRAAATRTTRLCAVDHHGATIGWIPTQTGPDAIEIPRSELATILAAAGRQHADFRYDDTVTAIQADADGVEVSFERGGPGRFDLVVGADGVHSAVRRLVFGPEQQFTAHLGLYIATMDLGRDTADPGAVLIHSAPGRAAIIHPTTGREGAAFIFGHPRLDPAEASDPSRQQHLILEQYDGLGWRVPELLDRVKDSADLYFDAVTRVGLDRWSSGRVTLVGDAAGCVSLLGEGSSMAILGAATLAQRLHSEPDHLTDALGGYERAQRRQLRRHHRGASLVGHLLVPRTGAGLALRDTAFRGWAAASSAHQRLKWDGREKR